MTSNESATEKLGFLEGIVSLFRRGEAAAPAAPRSEPLEDLQRGFQAALEDLNRKLERERQVQDGPRRDAGSPADPEERAAQRAAARARRLEEAHRAMREDIGRAHADLATGISGDDLEALGALARELDGLAREGLQSEVLLPRARHAILAKLDTEAGRLAADRVVGLLEAAGRGWPDPTRHRPSATQEDVERSRRRRLGEVREGFERMGLGRTAERMVGVVSGWGADYPDRGSPLWDECVLEGVAAGIRVRLLGNFVEALRRERDALLGSVEGSVGKQLEALQQALAGGASSLEQATAAVAGALRVIDEMLPETAWQHVCQQLPEARGEGPAPPSSP